MKYLISLFLSAALLPSLGAAQDCIDYSDYLHWAGGVEIPSSSIAVEISATHAFVAGDYGLHVVDITNPENPQIIGSIDTPDYAHDLAISGSHVYVADGGGGLQVVDITNPELPQVVGNVATQGYAWGVASSGSYAYVADGSSGLQVIDITNAESP